MNQGRPGMEWRQAMDGRKMVADYYGYWVSGDRSAARALLADDLRFRSPMDNFDSADAFFEKCWQYAEGFTDFSPVQEVYADNSAYVAYDVGGMMVGEFIRFRDGRICEIWVSFNVTA